MSAAQVVEAWNRIEAWCRLHHPRLLGVLNPGASEDEIDSLERAINLPLPEDIRKSLQIHNGESAENFLCGQLTLSTCEKINADWTERQSYEHGHIAPDSIYPENAMANRCYHESWVPIAAEEGLRNYLGIDLAPGPEGTYGQVIDFGRNIHDLGVISSSWGEFLFSYAKLLESGVIENISQELEDWHMDFEPVWNRACLDALVLWTMDGRWPIVDFDPSWSTSTVISLARTIDETSDFSSMPILADALQEAGCDVKAVLDHCRNASCTHTKGCWLIDTLLNGTVKSNRWCHKFKRAVWD